MGLSVKLNLGEFRVLELKRCRVRRFLREAAMEMEEMSDSVQGRSVQRWKHTSEYKTQFRQLGLGNNNLG